MVNTRLLRGGVGWFMAGLSQPMNFSAANAVYRAVDEKAAENSASGSGWEDRPYTPLISRFQIALKGHGFDRAHTLRP